MLDLLLPPSADGPAHVLCLGAHCDDIEIGCGATLLEWTRSRPLRITWAVLSSGGERGEETRRAARRLLAGAASAEVEVFDHRDGFLPYHGAAVKDEFEALKSRLRPDLVLTHYRHDLHQDHRLVSELTYNTFRRHLVLEYEIPKIDGDLGNPNLYVEVSRESAAEKIDTLLQCYATQRPKDWFDEELFLALLRLRGMEAQSASGLAEAFHLRRARLRV